MSRIINSFRFMRHLPTCCSAGLMFVVNRVPNCRSVIRNRIYGFMKRLVSSSNALVLSAVTSDARSFWDCSSLVEITYILMVVEIVVYQFSHLVSFVVSILMLVSGYIT